ncbi:MAG: ZIP family metal transporter, partial [Flavobacteriaceae bacterium]|nr:ZIP family metal transporter [Flavobacteriaceae bacterium]
ILIGIIFQTILEFFSKGAEHGHIHTHNFSKKIPWLIFISLSIHAFLEGLPLGLKENSDLLWAIVIHKIPITIVLVVFLQKSNLPKTLIYSFILIFSLMSPLGSLIGNYALFENYQTQINAIIIGVFLHISTAILFESSENHKFNYKKFIAIIIGFLIAMLISLHHI